jgi:hypothetical protein
LFQVELAMFDPSSGQYSWRGKPSLNKYPASGGSGPGVYTQCRSGHWLREGQAARLIFTFVQVPSYSTEVPRDSLNFSELASNFKVRAAPSNECRVTNRVETKFSQEHTDKASGLYSLDLQVVKTCYKHL